MTQTTAYEHIVINESSVALIEGTNMKVIELVLETTAHDRDIERRLEKVETPAGCQCPRPFSENQGPRGSPDDGNSLH